MKQERLFDPGPRSNALSVRQFMDKATWHGTKHPNWSESVQGPVHHGTAQAAADRNDPSYVTTVPMSGTRLEPNFYPIVANEVADIAPVKDNVANAGEAQVRGVPSGYPAPKHEREAAAKVLTEGSTLPYVNDVEDRGNVSFISPEGGYRTLADTTNYEDLPNRREFLTGTEMLQQGVTRHGGRGYQEEFRGLGSY